MAMSKLVILEDNPDRMEQFHKKLKDRAEIIHFEHVKEFTEYVKENKDNINIFFLDHDLGGKVYVDSNEEDTGYQAALFIKEIYGEEYPQTIIHSMNTIGAKKMKEILTKADVMPFPALIRGL